MKKTRWILFWRGFLCTALFAMMTATALAAGTAERGGEGARHLGQRYGGSL